MAIKILVAGGKGGTGKSAIARTLAACLRDKHGLDVCGIDADGDQASFWRWAADRQRVLLAQEIPVHLEREPKAINHAMGNWQYDAFITDGGAYVSIYTPQMAKHMDMVVVPTGHSTDDIGSVIRMANQLEKKGIPRTKMCVVFVKVSDSKKQDAQCRAYLESNGLFVAAGHIPQKDSYFEAMDLGLSLCEVRNAPRLFTCARITIDSILEYGFKLKETQ